MGALGCVTIELSTARGIARCYLPSLCPDADPTLISDPEPCAAVLQYLLKLPTDPGIVLPGLWMLFVIDAAGVPSVSKDIRIKSEFQRCPE